MTIPSAAKAALRDSIPIPAGRCSQPDQQPLDARFPALPAVCGAHRDDRAGHCLRHQLADLGAVALLVAVLVALRGRSLILVALCAAASVLVTDGVLGLI